jgi:hypothetical protein
VIETVGFRQPRLEPVKLYGQVPQACIVLYSMLADAGVVWHHWVGCSTVCKGYPFTANG